MLLESELGYSRIGSLSELAFAGSRKTGAQEFLLSRSRPRGATLDERAPPRTRFRS